MHGSVHFLLKELSMANETASVKTGSVNLQDDLEAVKEDLAQLRDDFAQLSSNTASQVGGRLKDRAAQRIGQLRDAYGAAKEKGGRALDSTTAQIEDHPWTAVGIAIGIGLLLGRMMDRK